MGNQSNGPARNGMGSAAYLWQQYQLHEEAINQQLQTFSERGRALERDELFRYLCLNLLSVQADWDSARKAISQLEQDNHLFSGNIEDVRKSLRAAKYRGRGKAKWIVQARKRFYQEDDPEFEIGIETLVLGLQQNVPSPHKRREILKGRKGGIVGFGMKTASHFLRGVNLSENQLAILDVRVLGQLLRFPELRLNEDGLVRLDSRDKPMAPGSSKYLKIEQRVKRWADQDIGIPLDTLDLLLWRLG